MIIYSHVKALVYVICIEMTDTGIFLISLFLVGCLKAHKEIRLLSTFEHEPASQAYIYSIVGTVEQSGVFFNKHVIAAIV